jgi:hypothetical protein
LIGGPVYACPKREKPLCAAPVRAERLRKRAITIEASILSAQSARSIATLSLMLPANFDKVIGPINLFQITNDHPPAAAKG